MSTGTKILIALVDDSKPLRRILSMYLSANGFEVVGEAEHGEDLLSQLKTAVILPQVCLLDANMPVMDGFETARHLSAGYPSIKILGFSFDFPDDIEKTALMMECGASAVLSKDAPPAEIRNALAALAVEA